MSCFNHSFDEKRLSRKRVREQRALVEGARFLKELIAACDGRDCYPIHIFSEEEITEAMDMEVYFSDGFSNYHKGAYRDRPILLSIYYRQHIDLFFNELVAVTQIHHRNVLKLLGCCFEMESPVLVYESVPNNLAHLLRDPNTSSTVSWENLLRVGFEMANAVTYLHTAKPRIIVHRDIKCSNILLDEDYRPKLCGFSLVVAIPLGKTHVETNVVGTFGYLAPECLESGTVTEKADIYSFGWLLLELLTGKKAFEFAIDSPGITTPRESVDEDAVERGQMELVEHVERLKELALEITRRMVLARVKELGMMLDDGLTMDRRKMEQAMACVELAGRCMTFEPDQRPSMKEVALQLQQIEKHLVPFFYSAAASFASSSSSFNMGEQLIAE